MLKRSAIIISLLILLCTPAYAVDQTVSFNPRDDFVFGVGSMAGGALGVIGIVADFNWYSTVNAGIGLGSGIYYDTYMAQAKYLILDRAFTPYIGASLAYWRNITAGDKLARKSETAVKLGMVKSDGTDAKDAILIFPVSFGVHYLSQLGLAVFVEADYLISLANLKGTPYAAIGLQYYF